jgi:hypothetical protein
MLKLDLELGEGVSIEGGRIRITVEESRGKYTRLAIDADPTVPIKRIEPEQPGRNPARKGLAKAA